MTYIGYSVLSSDFTTLAQDIESFNESHLDIYHLDVMDGSFVSAISFGSQMIHNIRSKTSKCLDCHLMVINPENHIQRFIDTGVEMISFHYEATQHHKSIINMIKQAGIKCGIAINPDTNPHVLDPYLDSLDFILQMSVQPGKGGQPFLPHSLENIRYFNQQRIKNNYSYLIEVDGGINTQTAAACIENGVDILITGSTLYTSNNTNTCIKELKQL